MSHPIDSKALKFDCHCELEKTTYLDVVKDDPKVDLIAVTGRHDSKMNLYEPPTGNMNFDALMGMVEGLKNDDPAKVYTCMKEVCSSELSYKWATKPRSPVQSSEAQVEHCLTSMIDLLHYRKTLEFINPSRGTLHRVARKYGRHAFVRFTRDVSETYISELIPMMRELNIGYDLKPWKVDPSVLYYVSFNGTLAERMGMVHYIGYEVNPSSLVNAGLCASMSVSNKYLEFEYYRGGQLKRFTYPKKSVNVIPVDVVSKHIRTTSNYKLSMGCMHDVYTTLDIFRAQEMISSKVQLTYDAKFLIGHYTDDGRNIYDRFGKVVYSVSRYAHSCRRISGRWKLPDEFGNIMAAASYMITEFTATVTRLGKKCFATPVKKKLKLGNTFWEKGKSYEFVPTYTYGDIVFDDDGNRVPKFMLPYRLNQGVGYEYCTSSYENVVSISVRYEAQDLINMVESVEDEPKG